MENLIPQPTLSEARIESVFCAGSAYPEEHREPRWYAAYTNAHHEKRVADRLRERDVEHFLPLYETLRRWKDRRVRLHLPLFPGYVFVRIALHERLKILQIPSLVRLIGFGGHPTPLPEQEIASLRYGLEGGIHAEPHPYLTAGRRVRIKSGPLAGMEGTLLRRKGSFRIVLSVELIMRSIVVEADGVDLEAIAPLSRFRLK